MSENRLKLLVVEDNPRDLELIRIQLEEDEPGGFEIRPATQLSTALAELQREPADLVLLDLGLPDADEFESLDRLRAEFPNIPVVVLTGGSAEQRGRQAIQRGAQDLLIKGFLGSDSLAKQLRLAVEKAATSTRLKRISERLESGKLKKPD